MIATAPAFTPALVALAVDRAPLAASPVHGEAHWKAVTWTGLLLAEHMGAEVDREVVALFGLFHDCCRRNEDSDPGHGTRAGNYAYRVIRGMISAPRLMALTIACDHHGSGMLGRTPTEAVCFDADRLNLWRVGIEPDLRLLSTPAARMLADTARLFPMVNPSWDELIAAT